MRVYVSYHKPVIRKTYMTSTMGKNVKDFVDPTKKLILKKHYLEDRLQQKR